MVQHPQFVSFKVDADVTPFQEPLNRFARHLKGLGIAVDLAGAVKSEDIDEYREQFATPTKGREAADVRWVAEHRGDWERMVIDGLAWLVAADEYVAAIEASKTETTTED